MRTFDKNIDCENKAKKPVKLSKHKLLFIFFILFALSGTGYGQTLPLHQIDLKGLNGERTTMEKIIPEGKIVILSFWATWCGPCKKEMDAIQKIYSHWQEKYNVALIAISIDDARTAGRVKATVLQKNWPYEVYQDVEGQSKQVFNFENIPFTAVLDSDGKLVYTHIGYSSGDEDLLEKKLAEID